MDDIDPNILDKKAEAKNRVAVRLTLPDVKTYKKHESQIKRLAEETGASMAVKMA